MAAKWEAAPKILRKPLLSYANVQPIQPSDFEFPHCECGPPIESTWQHAPDIRKTRTFFIST
jgi:hypothetical protein